jgi:hypothetical protein
MRRAAALHQKVFIAFIDFEKAYDNVGKVHLLTNNKMANRGFSAQMIRIINQVIIKRKFRVKVGSALASAKTAINGVPQGGPLSPLLYNILVGDLPEFVKINNPKVTVLQYAWHSAGQTMTATLDQLSKYCQVNRNWGTSLRNFPTFRKGNERRSP